MKIKLEVEACCDDEHEDLLIYAHAYSYKIALDQINQLIRNRLKYGENVSDEEEKILGDIRELTIIEAP